MLEKLEHITEHEIPVMLLAEGLGSKLTLEEIEIALEMNERASDRVLQEIKNLYDESDKEGLFEEMERTQQSFKVLYGLKMLLK